ncbi:hypothetical protein AMJ80_08150 [bacterium SM23_31]|nr:MAG: hypothetical protein AMJ80_08150 [bacterium SM23_31]
MNKNPAKPVFLGFKDIEVGREALFTRTVTEQDIDRFAEITGDYNPLHFDDDYARREQFDGRILPGLLTASFISRLIGMLLPGKQALYLSQEIKFVKPVYTGDTLLIKGTVLEKIPGKKNKIVLQTEIKNQHDAVVLAGSARILIRS